MKVRPISRSVSDPARLIILRNLTGSSSSPIRKSRTTIPTLAMSPITEMSDIHPRT